MLQEHERWRFTVGNRHWIMTFQSHSEDYLGNFLVVMIFLQIILSFGFCKYFLCHNSVSHGQQRGDFFYNQ